MDDPMTGCFLSDPLLHERLLRAEQFHRELIIGGLEEGLQLVLDEALLARFRRAEGRRPRLLLRGAVQRGIVHPKVHLKTM